MWLSLVERCVRDAEAAGSNPVASILGRGTGNLENEGFPVLFCIYVILSYIPSFVNQQGCAGMAEFM